MGQQETEGKTKETETSSQDSSGGGMTPYDVYRRDVVDASRFPIVGRVDVDAARAGARRVAWAVAGWYRNHAQLGLEHDLPASLQRVLEAEAPD